MIKYSNVVNEIKYEKFEDFYNEVIHYKGVYNNLLQGNIFRGHSSENFELVPRILRSNDNQCELLKLGSRALDTVRGQKKFEYKLLRKFQYKSNFNILSIPPLKLQSGKEYWEIENFDTIIGLAQHYGLPTRLLDWTHELNTALYFALIGNITSETFINGNYLVIWVLNWFDLQMLNAEFDNERILEDLIYIFPQYHSNPNLAAQKGVFTFWKENPRSRVINRKPLNELIFDACKKYHNLYHEDIEFPLLHKIMISKNNLKEIYQYLSSLNWKAAKLFPGYSGVIKEMEEDSYFERFF